MGQWIPVNDETKKWPAAGVYVLVTAQDALGSHVEIAKLTPVAWVTADNEWLAVIAWQPLPEPYAF